MKKLKLFAVLIPFIAALFLTPNRTGAENGKAQKAVKKTGTFSSLNTDNQESDLLGMELRIVHWGASGREGYDGTIQFAEGVADRLILIKDIQFSPDNKVKFSFILEDGKSITFKGKISSKEISGSFFNGFWHPIILKRKNSYWD